MHWSAKDDLMTEEEYFLLARMDDAIMTAQELRELPKVWVIGGDGALGDIGFQNVSKVILQNRPNVKVLMLDTQVYSNTGGQNSDSSTMLGGYDMNQFGAASQGKLTENVAEAFTSGHGSPFAGSGLDGQFGKALQSHARWSGISPVRPSSKPIPLVSLNMECPITCRPIKPSWLVTHVPCLNLYSTLRRVKPHKKLSISRVIRHLTGIGGKPNTPPVVRNTISLWRTGR